MIDFSSSLGTKGLPTSVGSQKDIDQLMDAFHATVKDLNLWQYYVLDVTKERETVKSAIVSKNITTWGGPSVTGKSDVEIAAMLRSSGKIHGLGTLGNRFAAHVDGAVSAGIITAAFVDVTDADALSDAWIRVVDVVNVALYQEWDADINVALENVKNRVQYTRLDAAGPKLGPISNK
jgi:glycogen debranching enzyme